MVKVQYSLSRSKRLARELGSSYGERPEIALPALLSEQFDEPAVICTGKDGHTWVTFFLLKMWVSYFPIIYLWKT